MKQNTSKPDVNIEETSIYLISLKSEEERRSTLARNFIETYTKINLVDAVDGRNLTAREYFNILNSRKKGEINFLTPSEVGCTLSHELALSKFLETEKRFALILEDDVIGNDDDIKDILGLTKYLGDNSILICGGQPNAHLIKKLLIGKLIADDIYQVASSSLPYLSRTCCYLVDRIAAKAMIESYQMKIKVADSWWEISNESNVIIYFTDKLGHPDDLAFSTIESERQIKSLGPSAIIGFRTIQRIRKRLLAELLSKALVGIFGWRRML